MLLYACKTCGRWQDVTLSKALSDVFANLSKSLSQPPPEQLGYPCPAGHGLMLPVGTSDRIFVHPNEIESERSAEQLKGINEIAQLSQDLGMYE